MNIHPTGFGKDMDQEDAARLMRQLREWAAEQSDAELAAVDPALRALRPGPSSAYPEFSARYPEEFVADDIYRSTMPDLQNGPAALIRGARRQIQHVGISNFRLPVRFHTRTGGDMMLETSVTGTVSLDAESKGINMSRIMRTFYRRAEETFSYKVIEATLDDYKDDLGSFDARIVMRLSYPQKIESLRSGLEGYQYYDIALEVIDMGGVRHRVMHLDYLYSSTCPCSLELSEHARRGRGQLATPHSQRSVARLSVEIDESGDKLWFEDLIDLCRAAVPTETQVMVKREDEQAFAELNAANPIFVEDAARLFAQALASEQRIADFRVVASHQESLHSHDAVSVLTEGDLFRQISLDPRLFQGLYHVG